MDIKGKDSLYSKLFHVIVDKGILAGMSGSELKIYHCLLRHVNDVTRNCWPSNETITRETGVCLSSIPKHTKRLHEHWMLCKKWRKDRKNFYHMYNREELEDLHPKNAEIRPHRDNTEILKDDRGRFVSPQNINELDPKNIHKQHPKDTDLDNPKNTDNKKNYIRRKIEKETKKKMYDGSALACLESQASPVSPMLKSYIGQVIDAITCKCLVDLKGEEAIQMIRSGRIKLQEGVNLNNGGL